MIRSVPARGPSDDPIPLSFAEHDRRGCCPCKLLVSPENLKVIQEAARYEKKKHKEALASIDPYPDMWSIVDSGFVHE